MLNHYYSTHQINVPHNLTHSGRCNQYVTIGYDIIMGDIQVYVSHMDFETWADVKDMKRFEKHCESVIRAKHNPELWQPTEADIEAHKGWVAAGEPY